MAKPPMVKSEVDLCNSCAISLYLHGNVQVALGQMPISVRKEASISSFDTMVHRDRRRSVLRTCPGTSQGAWCDPRR